MKTLLEYINESIQIIEGGHAVECNPIPAYITPLVYKEIEDKILKYNKDIKLAPLGSIGKKFDDDFNGDIDIAINITDKDKLIEMINNVFPNCEINPNTMRNIVSIGYPYNKEGKSGIGQVDFMMTNNMKWTKWRFDSPNLKTGESKYKAKPKIFLLQHMVSSIPVKDAKTEYFEDGVTVKRKWKYTFNEEGVFKQLVDFTGKKGPLKNGKKLKEFESLITNDPDNVMRFIFGDNYDPKDFVSAERLWKALHSDKWPWGKEACEFTEKRFYEEYINNPKIDVKVDPKDFPLQYYKNNK